MPTITEVVAYGLVGTASVVSLWRLGVIIWKTRRRMSVKLDLDTSGFVAHIERLSNEMQAQIEQRIGQMGTEDIVRAMMGREMARHLDEELMHGVEGTTESIPQGLPVTTSHTRTPEQHFRMDVEREATRVAATLGVPYEDALAALEGAWAAGRWEPGMEATPFIDPATGQLTYAVAYETSEPPPIVYVWQDERCPIECHIYDETHDIYDHAAACLLCERYAVWYHSGGADAIAGSIGRELVEPPTVDEAEEASMRPEPAPPAHPWMRAERCYSCPRYDPELGPGFAAAACRGDDAQEHNRDWQSICTLYADWQRERDRPVMTDGEEYERERVWRQDPATGRLIEDTDIVVPARCPWMTPDTCDPCTRRTPAILPGTQAVLCAGHDDDPAAFECAVFDRWREANPTHHLLGQLLHRERQAAKPCIRVIRFRPDK